jgi:hypothetical protein
VCPRAADSDALAAVAALFHDSLAALQAAALQAAAPRSGS